MPAGLVWAEPCQEVQGLSTKELATATVRGGLLPPPPVPGQSHLPSSMSFCEWPRVGRCLGLFSGCGLF